MTTTANDLLMGARVPTAKLTQGDVVEGRILAISEPYQEREYDAKNPGGGAPKTFSSGDPIMTFHLDIATSLRDPGDADDDGTRRLYMDGARIKRAIRAACLAAGAVKGLAVGGHLSVTCTHYDVDGDIRSGKNYAATYTPGAPANNVLMGQQPPVAPAPAPVQQYAPQPVQQAPVAPVQAAPVAPVAPAIPAPDPAQVAAVVAANLDPRTVFAASHPAWAATYTG